MNMFVCLSTSQTNEHWPLIGRTNEHDLTNTVRLFIGHPERSEPSHHLPSFNPSRGLLILTQSSRASKFHEVRETRNSLVGAERILTQRD